MTARTKRREEPSQRALPAIGRYRLVSELGFGATSHVYLARAAGYSEAGIFFAIKILRDHWANKPAELAKFFAEQRLAAKIKHRRVIGVHEVGTDRGRNFAALQYVRGEPLDFVLRTAGTAGRFLSPEALAHLFAAIAEGVHAAHELEAAPDDARGAAPRSREGLPISRGPQQGAAPGAIVHTALLAKNVLLGFDGVPRIGDCGVRQVAGEGETLAAPVDDMLASSAPELLLGKAIDHRADIFALGVLFWEASTGARLFRRRKPVDTLRAVLEEDIPRPSFAQSNYPRELETLVMRALERDPSRRPETALELATALREFAGTRAGELDAADEARAMMHEIFAEKLDLRLAAERQAIAEMRKLRGASPVPVEIVVGDLTRPDLEDDQPHADRSESFSGLDRLDSTAEHHAQVSVDELLASELASAVGTVDIEAPTHFELKLAAPVPKIVATVPDPFEVETKLIQALRTRPEIELAPVAALIEPPVRALPAVDTRAPSIAAFRRGAERRRKLMVIGLAVFGVVALALTAYAGI